MIALIDGDLVLYRCAASCEPTRAKEFLEPEEVAIRRADDLMERILYTTGADDFELYMGGEGNHRYAIYPAYKGNRTAPKPTWFNSVREHLATRWDGKIVNGMETDDKLGIQQTRYDGNSLIASLDKDLLQISGNHFNWVSESTCYVSPLQGLHAFYKQVITGDATDNIPSFDGKFRNKTPIFVQKLIDPLYEMTDEKAMYEYALSVYAGSGQYYDAESVVADVDRNAQLLYILREEEIYWSKPDGVQLDCIASLLECYEAEQDDIPPNINA